MIIDHGIFASYTPATPVLPAMPTAPPPPAGDADAAVLAAYGVALSTYDAARAQWWADTAADRKLIALIEAKTAFLKNAANVDWYSIAHAAPAEGRIFAVLRDGVVISQSADPSSLFPIDGHLIETDTAAPLGWKLIDGALVNPTTIAPTKAELSAYAGEAAWRKEIAGKTVSGIPVTWTERSKVLLMGAAGTLSDEAVAPYVSGSLVVQLTGAQFKAIYAAMVAHTQGCFVTRAAVLGQIEAETITTKAQIDAAFL